MRMIKISDTALVAPLKIAFSNCVRCGVLPQLQKHASIVPFYKKNEII